ncbi:hypothetical protein FKM82_011075 [Ascaphus truei]
MTRATRKRESSRGGDADGSGPPPGIRVSGRASKSLPFFTIFSSRFQVCVIFNDFEKMQSVSNTLVEKLNSSISICSPQFYHTPECVEKLRREVCLSAVSNARQKAQDVCLLVGQSLGRPLMIKEEEMKEWEDQGENNSGSPTIQQKIKSCTLHAASKVFATFEIKGKVRPKNN